MSEDFDSAEGVRVKGSKRTSFPISMKIWLRGRTIEERAKEKVMLASILDVDDEAKLWFEDQGDLYYLAMPSGDFTVEEYMNRAAVNVSFLVAKPWMYGARRAASVPSSGSAPITFGGTDKVEPLIAANQAVRETSSRMWGICIGQSDKLRVELPDSLPHDIVLDCAKRICTVDGEVTIPVIYDDWYKLAPGTYPVRCCLGRQDSITVSWQERWS